MRISVVIPTHNRADTLPRALDSIRSQSTLPAEVIVVDDGSTDGSAELVGRDYPEVLLLTQDNAGVSAARNRGIAGSSGDWVAFLDSDDEWLPGKLESQVAALNADPTMLLCHTDEVWIRSGVRVNPKQRHRKHGGWIFEHCLPLCAMSPSSVVVKRELLDDVGVFDESLPACEDYDLWLRITCRYPVLYVDEPQLRKYGGHDDQLSRKFWGMDRFRIQALEKLLRDSPLTSSQRHAATTTLRQKLDIVRNGAAKRGRLAEAQDYEERLAALGEEAADGAPAG